jgi:phage tail sheath protein FI
MSEYKFNSAGISAQEIGLIGPTDEEDTPQGRNACVIGTSFIGPAFVPLTLGTQSKFQAKFGDLDAKLFGPFAVREWLNNANSVTYLRVLGIGDGKKRDISGDVTSAGFTVGEELPFISSSGYITSNSFASSGGPLGRTYFLGCFMSESEGNTYFSSAGLQGTGSQNNIVAASVPIIRGILMAPSGVILRLSSSGGGYNSNAPPLTYVANESTAYGTTLGSVTLLEGNNSVKQEFVLLLNGYAAGDTAITASFDMQAPNYFPKVFNTTASYIQEKGHFLYTHFDIHPTVAQLTGTNVVTAGAGATSDSNRIFGTERSIFLITSSLARNVGSTTVPNYENFRDRFTHAKTPWFVSQDFRGNRHNLFRLHLLGDGTQEFQSYKITINNITPATSDSIYKYGTFDILVRNLIDPDGETSNTVEKFVGVTLDPSSDKYISKEIGDVNAFYDFDRPDNEQKLVIEGNYPLKSNIIRVEVSEDVKNKKIPFESLPVGFRGISHLVTSGSAPLAALNSADASALISANYIKNAVQPPLPMRFNNRAVNLQTTPSTNKSWGVMFDHAGQNSNNIKQPLMFLFGYINHYPEHASSNANFAVGDNVGTLDTPANGIMDSDRFCHNFFTLENIKIITGSNGTVDPPYNWNLAEYVRSGDIPENHDEKSRRIGMGDFLSASNAGYLRYDVILQGGFNGVNIFDADEADLTSAAVKADMADPSRGRLKGPSVTSYKKSLEIVGNSTNVDFSIFAIPGIREPVITDEAAQVAEDRFDALYVMDLENGSTPKETAEILKNRVVNSSFAAAYYPDAVIRLSPQLSTEYTVPPSVVVLGALSLNDSIGQPWFAPAGVTRGKLISTVKTTVPLNEKDLDTLYKSNINPLYATTNIEGINQFQNVSAVVTWGQKTLQLTNAAVNRINVRRLLIEARRAVKEAAQTALFEPNRPESSTRLINIISERLATIKSLGGMDDFKVTLSPSNDPEFLSIRGRVYIKPKKTQEFVTLDFSVSNNE